jgi:hypothetical protein
MPTIQTASFNDLLASLDDWAVFSSQEYATLFIGAIGFEHRSSACFEKWCVAVQGKGCSAILIRYPFNRTEDKEQETKFLGAAKAAGVAVFQVEYNQRSIFGEIVGLLKASKVSHSMLLDLSSLASFVLYPLFAAVLEVAPRSAVRVCYTEAAAYFPGREEWETFQAKVQELDLYDRARLFDEQHFQSSGVNLVFECAPFIGHNRNNLPTTLIVVPNFAFERVNRMIDFVSERYSVPRERCEWIIGVPPDREKNGWRHDAVWRMFDKPKRKHEASTLNYKEMLLVLHQLWEERRNTASLAVATVGSKAGHLGTFLFLVMHPEVALILSQPKEFIASRFSEGIGTQRQLDLGVIGDLADKLVGWNKVEFNW